MSPKKYFSKKRETTLGECCVLMPFAEEFGDVYEAIRSAVEGGQVCFHCTRADEFLQGGSVMNDILALIGRAEIIVADLTTYNPNVFYELGIAHTVKKRKKIILIAQNSETSLPFDVSGLRVLKYDVTDGFESLKRQLVDSFAEIGEYSWQFKVENGGSYKKESQIFGLDEKWYEIELDQMTVGLGDAATFNLVLNLIEDGKIVNPPVLKEKKTLREGDKLAVPGLGWTLQLKKTFPGMARFGISRPEPMAH